MHNLSLVAQHPGGQAVLIIRSLAGLVRAHSVALGMKTADVVKLVEEFDMGTEELDILVSVRAEFKGKLTNMAKLMRMGLTPKTVEVAYSLREGQPWEMELSLKQIAEFMLAFGFEEYEETLDVLEKIKDAKPDTLHMMAAVKAVLKVRHDYNMAFAESAIETASIIWHQTQEGA